jgi:transaldolase / glucose-6-phosphate isomerase
MRGKAGVANARLAYQEFLEIFGSARFRALAEKGARVQRPLWASTGVKDPAYKDTLYCEELIGPDSVNTVPPATLNAFREHGIVRGDTILESVEYSEHVEQQLKALGIELEEVGRELEVDGVKKFDQSFDNLLGGIEEKRQRIKQEDSSPYSARLGALQGVVESTLEELNKRDIPRKLDQRDPSAWSDDPEVQREIRDRLGWLTVVDQMEDEGAKLRAFAERIRDEGFRDVVLLGMGGSSLAPEVLKQTFGSVGGFPTLHVLDTTDPDAIRRVEQSSELQRTLFIVSSKSGGTIETATLGDYFWERCGKNGRQFIAITDPGTDLAQQASDRGYRQVFSNQPDIGGRYSALSYFGLVPAALIGVDVGRLISSALEMEQACDHCVADMENPGVWLGGVIGALAREGRDKLTFVLSPEVGSFGLWVEQLIAESTGKQGKGIVPIAGEELGAPDVYGNDRVFVAIRVGEGGGDQSRHLDDLAAAGHPLITIRLKDAYDLGGQFLLWEMATAIAGSVLGINPFDQPNVQESKDNTKRILDELAAAGRLPSPGEARSSDGIAVFAGSGTTARDALRQTLKGAGPGSYVALMAYLPESEEAQQRMDQLRTQIRDRLKVATTFGYGPRFLHSTGQLHKGGASVGTFIQITAEPGHDVEIPGRPFSFAQLEAAQALGDLQALQSRNRPVARIDVGRDTLAGLDEANSVVKAALSPED